MSNWKEKEREARRAIEDHGFAVHDANVLFRENCPNIDLVVFGKKKAIYVQVKSSNKPATKDGVLVDGSPWNEQTLHKGAPIYNRHRDNFQASFVIIVDSRSTGEISFYIVPPRELERVAVKVGRAFWTKPMLNGGQRKYFRKEVPRSKLKRWHEAWKLLGETNHSKENI